MAISMAKTIKEERLRWVLPIAQKEARLVDVVRVCYYNKFAIRSIKRLKSLFSRHIS